MIPVSGEKVALRFPLVTVALMAACVWAFVAVQPSGDEAATAGDAEASELRFTVDYAAIPCEVTRGKSLTETEYQEVFVQLQTSECSPSPSGPASDADKNIYLALLASMFMHGGWVHLLGNMVSLWVFGTGVELQMGRVAYLAFYASGGVVATLGYIFADPTSAIPIIGASGAIAAVMGAYLVMFPFSTIRVWLLVLIPMPAFVFLGAWFAFQFTLGDDSGIAWMAHVTGFVVGAIGAGYLRLRAGRPEKLVPAPPGGASDERGF